MEIGFIGLGKMGGNMTRRLIEDAPDGSALGGHTVIGFAKDPNPDLAGLDGFTLVGSLDELIARLKRPRVVWVMVPAGDPTESVITQLAERFAPGDLIIDGGNSYFKDSARRGEGLGSRGIGFMDVGTSGGIWGRTVGYCMMVGGADADVARVKPLLDTLAPANGWAHVGRVGAGHFVKMIHNGIEYGLMEAYGEGFEILSKSKFDINLHQVAAVWNRGSVVRSWLLELAEQMLAGDATLRSIQPYVQDSGEGRWTLQAAIEEAVSAPVIAASLFARFASRDADENFSARFAAALRKQFGGHDVNAKDVVVKTEQKQLQKDGGTEGAG